MALKTSSFKRVTQKTPTFNQMIESLMTAKKLLINRNLSLINNNIYWKKVILLKKIK